MGKRKRTIKDDTSGQPRGPPAKKRARNEEAKAKRAVLSGPTTPFVSNPSVEDRKREAYLYENLGSEVPEDRTKAAVIIVSSLQDAPEEVLTRHLSNRLFRGLASGRNAARLGFSLVITELLRELFGEQNKAEKYTSLSFDRALDFLVDKTRTGGNVPGQEERDHYFGQLFGLQCFVEAGILFSDSSRWTRVLGLLFKLTGKKVWLRSQCGWVIVKALRQMDEKFAVDTLERVSNAGMGRTPEGVAMWLVAMDRFPGIHMPDKPWKNPLMAKSLDSLADVLKEKKPPEGEDTKIKQGNWTAQLHFVWDIILAHYLKLAGKSDKDHGQQFKVFWGKVVDDGLFSKRSTDYQRFSGLSIFEKMLEGGYSEPSILENLFSKNVMSCLMIQAAKKDAYLHLAATKALGTIETTAERHPESIPIILKQLLGKRGAYNFNQVTTQKTVTKCLQHSYPVVAECLSICQKPLMKLEKSDVEHVAKYLHAYSEYLSKLASAAPFIHEPVSRNKKSKDMSSPEAAIVKELATFAYSNVEHPVIKPALTLAIRDVFRSRLEQVFAKLVKRPSDSLILCDAMQSVNANAVAMDKTLSKERDTALKTMRKLLEEEKQLSATSSARKGLLQGLALLYAATLSQLYAQDPDAFILLQDLARVVEKIEKDSGKEENEQESKNSTLATFLVETLLSLLAKKSVLLRQVSVKVFEAFSETMDLEALQLLTDTLFAEENEDGYRSLFEAGGEEEGDEDPSPSSSGGDDDDDADDDSDSDNAPDDAGNTSVVEADSDVEFLGLEDASDVEELDADSDHPDAPNQKSRTKPKSQDTCIPNSTASAENLAALDDALAKLLNSQPLSHNAADPDVSSSSSSDEDMSDSEMLALDAQLVEVFKQRLGTTTAVTTGKGKSALSISAAAAAAAAKKKKDTREARETVINFKRRVLDLLGAFLCAQPLNPLALELLVPLLAAMRATSTKLVSSRVGDIVEGFFRILKKARTSGGVAYGGKNAVAKETATTTDTEALKEILSSIHAEAGRDKTHAFARVASKAALAVVTVLVKLGGEDELKFVDELYGEMRDKREKGKIETQQSFFLEYKNWRVNQKVGDK